jgi:hypothetical protein
MSGSLRTESRVLLEIASTSCFRAQDGRQRVLKDIRVKLLKMGLLGFVRLSIEIGDCKEIANDCHLREWMVMPGHELCASHAAHQGAARGGVSRAARCATSRRGWADGDDEPGSAIVMT